MDTNGAIVPIHPQDAVAILIFLPVALLANILAGQARLRAAEAEQRRREADALAEQQAALRRVATLVARGTSTRPRCIRRRWPSCPVDSASTMWRCCSTKRDSAWCCWPPATRKRRTKMAIGERLSLAGESVAALVHRHRSACADGQLRRRHRRDRGPRPRARAALGGRRADPGGRRDMGCAGDRLVAGRADCRPKPRPASGISPTSSPPRSPMPRPARSSPRRVRAS